MQICTYSYDKHDCDLSNVFIFSIHVEIIFQQSYSKFSSTIIIITAGDQEIYEDFGEHITKTKHQCIKAQV